MTRSVLRAWLLLLCCAAVACVRGLPPEPADDLAGLELPLVARGGVRMTVAGEVEGTGAQVSFEVSQPRTSVSTACFQEAPSSDTTVRFPTPHGGFAEAPEIQLRHLRIGGRRLGAIRAALIEDDECKLTLGSDVLAPYALTVDPATRVLRVTHSRPRQEWIAEANSPQAQSSGYELQVLELVRDPSGDWPMLAVRVRQGEAMLTGAFVLATGAPESTISTEAANEAGLQKGSEILRDLGFPALYPLERLELTPGFGLQFAALRADEAWNNPGAVGVLGGDVWGHFIASVDPAAGVLVLRRPRVRTAGERQRCEAGTGQEAGEEGCFVLHQQDQPNGLELVATIWRDLPRGARLYFDVFDDKGQPIGGQCRVGVTFGRNDRGASAAHVLPWEGLTRAMPECAEALSHAAQVRYSLWEVGPLPECPGNCAFVWDTGDDQVSCECESTGAGAMSESERRFLEMYRELLQHGGRPPPEHDPDEPADPD